MEFPQSFISQIERLLGEADAKKFFLALNEEQPTSIRLNPLRKASDTCLTAVDAASSVPWASHAFYLSHRPAFTFDPLFHAGCYYVQEASSMFVEQAVRQYLPEDSAVVLDLCAAPGGKSTLLRSLLPDECLLVANEVIRNRSQILAENLTKWGHPNVAVTNNDPSDFTQLSDCFDMILADVPCSGEGMFRKDAEAVSEWSLENVDICYQRQRRIVADVWPALKPGGVFIYSTCTYNTLENEENVRWICKELGAEVLPLQMKEEWQVSGNHLAGEEFPVYRFLPHRTCGEGFFMAVLRKDGDATDGFDVPQPKSSKQKKGQGGKMGQTTLAKDQTAMLKQWILCPEDCQLVLEEQKVSALPLRHASLLTYLRSTLRVLLAGVSVAELKGKDWLPTHALAMSILLDKTFFPKEEISYEQAIAYLRKEVIVLSADAPRGIVLLTYQGHPIGFVKNVGNRANNLYPQEWRIRSSHVPEKVLVVK